MFSSAHLRQTLLQWTKTLSHSCCMDTAVLCACEHAWQTIHMQCQGLFSLENDDKIQQNVVCYNCDCHNKTFVTIRHSKI